MDGENTPPELSNTGKSLHLPKEIIEEILSSLPVKSLLRFRCVSKSWYCLIGSKRFIKTQLEKSKKYQYNARWEIIFNFNSESPVPGLKRGSMNSYSHDPSIYPSPIDDPSHNHLNIGSDIVGHCNGLLCMLKLPGSFFLWNPATRISIELPKLDLEITKLGFGWDEQSDAYKVFAVGSKKNENENENEEEWIGNVYSSKTNSWKTVEHGSLRLYQLSGEFVCGKLHWAVGAAGGYIETFDLKSEVFGTIEMPFKPKLGFDVWLEPQREPEEERGARLSVVYDDNVTRKVWEMKKYGVKASWTKVGGGAIPSEFASTCMCWKIDDKGEVKFFPREKVVGCTQKFCYIESLVSPAPQECLKQYGDLY